MADSDTIDTPAPAAPPAVTPLASDPMSGLMQLEDTSAVAPAKKFVQDFSEGGLHQALGGAGVKMPEWMQSIAGFMHKPGVETAIGMVGEFPKAHPDWINTRLVTSKKAVATNEPQIVGMEAMKETPDLYEKNVGLVRDYANTPRDVAKMHHDDVAEHFIEHVKDNLVYLHDQVPANIRDRSKLWYEGGNKIVKQWAEKYGISESSAAGALAALSPQKDWFQNVSLAERVLDTMKGKEGVANLKMTPEMEQTFARIGSDAKTGEMKPEWASIFKSIKGKSLAEIEAMDLPATEKIDLKAAWLRTHDEAHRSSSYPLVTPEGGLGEAMRNDDGTLSKRAWGSLVEVGKAIRAIENPEEMHTLMGEKHKVRNFYNNLLDPFSERGDVTIDTHAVAAGLLRPLSGKSIEVAHNFANYPGKGLPSASGSAVTGIQGTYPLYAEAYRRAAAERGILPREMQSITWEAVRGLFPDTFKSAKNKAKVDSIWNDYATGKIGIDDARQQVLTAAGGIRPPDWHAP